MSYEYMIEEFTSTEKTVSQNDLDMQPNLLEDMAWDFYNHFIDRLAYRLHEEEGISVLEGEVLLCQPTTQDVGRGWRRIHIFLSYRIVTDQPIHESHSPFVMADWVMLVVKWVINAIVIIILGWIAIQAIKECVQSLVLKTTTVTKHVSEPEDPGYCTYETTTIIEPEPFNVLVVVAGVVVIVAVAAPLIASYLLPERAR